ncbi:MAG: ExbD/TolR family protein [Bdellovibrionales bacterium]
MLAHSILKQSQFQSPLLNQSKLKPRGHGVARPLVFTLMLTSLVDAFAILLIFLLLNNNTTDPRVQIKKDIRLPEVTQSTNLDYGIMVRVENGRYFVEEKEISAQDLPRALMEQKNNFKADDASKKVQLIVQADKKANYEILNPIILAASHVGFEQFKFAVLPTMNSRTGR